MHGAVGRGEDVVQRRIAKLVPAVANCRFSQSRISARVRTYFGTPDPLMGFAIIDSST